MSLNYQSQLSPESKMRSPDRILMIEVMEGKKPIDVRGLVDPRLFSKDGDTNRLHAVMDIETTLWSFKYDKGTIPQALSGKFTGFRQAFDTAKNYFEKRNLKITQVVD